MRCMACGAVMHLIEVQPAESSMGPGFEQNKYQCSGCKDVEQRLVFNSPNAGRREPVDVHPAAASSVAPDGQGEQAETDQALLRNAWERLRGWRKSL
jgi:hypothetical protein